ncbi:MAG: hypothetical protein V4542_10215 [Pseudomonadota bacterium]
MSRRHFYIAGFAAYITLGLFMKLAKKLAAVSLEYQASVYAKETKLVRSKSQERQQKNLRELRVQLKALKEQLRSTHAEAALFQLKKAIEAKENAIKNSPRPKRSWSPVLPGSFESSTG